MTQWVRLDDFGFPDYSVSDEGEVRNDKTNRYLSQSFNQSGTRKVGLVRSPGEPPNTLVVPRLVASIFLEEPPHNFDTPINLNGDRTDNRAENLAWRPRWFAIRYNQQFKRPAYTFNYPIVLIDHFEIFEQPRDAAIKYGLLEADIVADIQNQRGVWPFGFEFRIYKE